MKKLIRAFTCFCILLPAILASNANAMWFAPDKIKGMVVYSDNQQPVRGGTVEVITSKTGALGRIVLEKVMIQADGSFIITKNFISSADEIKIMAYPNDVDGAEPEFRKCEFLTSEVLVKDKEGNFSMLLKVERVSSKSGIKSE